MPHHEMKELIANDQKLTIFEYKKELSQIENQKLDAFLSKIESGLKDEGGLDGIIQICNEWRKEVQKIN